LLFSISTTLKERRRRKKIQLNEKVINQTKQPITQTHTHTITTLATKLINIPTLSIGRGDGRYIRTSLHTKTSQPNKRVQININKYKFLNFFKNVERREDLEREKKSTPPRRQLSEMGFFS
jgi:hypothetical protein